MLHLSSHEAGPLAYELSGILSRTDIVNPRLDTELIISHAMKVPRLELHFERERKISALILRKIGRLAERRLAGEPLQYVFGEAWFRNLRLKVGPSVLIPRPETELLVGHVCAAVPHGGRVCDIGTGSGAIALSVAQERLDLKVTGVDASEKALKYARLNRKRAGVRNAVFLKSRLFSALKKMKFHVIAANLPYVPDDEYENLPREIRKFEPKSALAAGADGLKFIRPLIMEAHRHLEKGGVLMIEFSPPQKREIRRIAADTEKYRDVEFLKDLSGKIRFAVLAAGG